MPQWEWGTRTHIMGVINITPDSFSDGGRFLQPEAALAHARQLVADGADILDVGAESTAPGAAPVSQRDELARLLPVVECLAAELPVPISVDTYKAEVARRAVAAGAAIVNDVRGLRGDPDMLAAVASLQVPAIAVHNRRLDPDCDPVAAIERDFSALLGAAAAAGVSSEAIWLDPGFGFGKGAAANLALTRGLSRLRRLGQPLVYGPSRKRTLGLVAGGEPAERDPATVGLASLAASAGADVVRVHNVALAAPAIRMVDATVRGWPAAGSDLIVLSGIAVEGIHGAYPEERLRAQPFLVDVQLQGDWRSAAAGDDLHQAIDYTAVRDEVARVMAGPRCDLLETLAERIALALLDKHAVAAATVRIHKPEAPFAGPVNDVAVEVTRTRADVRS